MKLMRALILAMMVMAFGCDLIDDMTGSSGSDDPASAVVTEPPIDVVTESPYDRWTSPVFFTSETEVLYLYADVEIRDNKFSGRVSEYLVGSNKSLILYDAEEPATTGYVSGRLYPDEWIAKVEIDIGGADGIRDAIILVNDGNTLELKIKDGRWKEYRIRMGKVI